MTFVRVRQAQVQTGKAASRTIRRRSLSLATVRHTVTAGDGTTQLAHEIHSCNGEDRQRLLEEIRNLKGNFLVRIPAEKSVAMKADLNIPWNKLRIMRRYINKMFN